MAVFESIRITLPDGYEAYGRYWKPDRPRGAVLYHHGIQSHCGWYERSAQALCQAGFAVLQVDRRGSGANPQDRGHASSADQLIADAQAAGEELQRRSGLEHYHVVGVSWGGKLAVAAYVTDPGPILSLSLVTPGLFPIINVSATEKARIGLSMLHEPRKLFDIPLNDGTLFTTRPEWQRFVDADPLCLRQCSASFYLASRRMDKIIAKLTKMPPVPIHLMLACDERIIDNDATAIFLRTLYWGGTRITWYTRARHSLEFDEPEAYFDDLISFICTHPPA